HLPERVHRRSRDREVRGAGELDQDAGRAVTADLAERRDRVDLARIARLVRELDQSLLAGSALGLAERRDRRQPDRDPVIAGVLGEDLDGVLGTDATDRAEDRLGNATP